MLENNCSKSIAEFVDVCKPRQNKIGSDFGGFITRNTVYEYLSIFVGI